MANEPFRVRLPDEVHERLHARAIKDDWPSASAMVRAWVEKELGMTSSRNAVDVIARLEAVEERLGRQEARVEAVERAQFSHREYWEKALRTEGPE